MRFVIIGGDAAGMSAAMQIVRNSDGNEIIALEKGEIYSYGACGLPYVLSGKISSTQKLIARTPETFRNKYHIDARTLHEVTEVETVKKVVRGTNHQSQEPFEITYDRLLIATGTRPIIPKWEGVNLKGIFSLKTIPDAKQILAYLEKEIRSVAIIGGGYIGLEVAESFVGLGKSVKIFERNEQIAKIFDSDMAALIHQEAIDKGIDLHFNENVIGFKGMDHVEQIATDKDEYSVDLVIVATGVSPNTDFLKGSGIYMHGNGAIQVNPHMETNITDIYAAGDCATQFHRIKERDVHIPLGTHANKQGVIAGLNMVNIPKSFKGVVGSSIIKFFDLTLGRTGLSEKEAKEASFPYKVITIESKDIAGYYPGWEEMKIKIVYHEETMQLLGGQIIGGNGVDKRIDVLATALYHRMTIAELLDLDLTYAPPYNGVWDPIQQAARRAT